MIKCYLNNCIFRMAGDNSTDVTEVDDSGIRSMVGLHGNAKFWMGKDYTNFIVKDFNNLDRPYQGKLYSTN